MMQTRHATSNAKEKKMTIRRTCTWYQRSAVLALCCLLAFGSALAQQSNIPNAGPDTKAIQPRQAYVASPVASAAGLCLISDDYEAPQAVYYNGVPLTVKALEKSRGGYPVDILNDPEQMWAFVTIGGKQDTGVYGYMPVACLQYADEAKNPPPALPKGVIAGQVALHRDNGLTQDVVATLNDKTEVEVLGRLQKWFHVRAGEQAGFVPLDAVQLSSDQLELVNAGLPMSFDGIGPGMEKRYDEYAAKLDQLYMQNGGEVADFSLEAKAEASKLAQEYGFEYMPYINVLPGPGDLKQEDALARGKAALKEKYGLGDEAIEQTVLSFYHWPDKPEEHFWQVSILAKPGYQNAWVTLDAAGQPVEYKQSEWVNNNGQAVSLDPASDVQNIAYYRTGTQAQPQAGDLPQAEAIEKAWQHFSQAYPQAQRSQYQLNAELWQNADASLRWWLVGITLADQTDSMITYDIAVLADGKSLVASNPADYDEMVRANQQMIEMSRLEQERGPLAGWTLQQKAEYLPSQYALPKDTDIAQEKAIQIARGYLKTAYQLKDADFEAWKPYAFYLVDGQWQIDFLTDEMLESGLAGYSVFINAATGEVVDAWGFDPQGQG